MVAAFLGFILKVLSGPAVDRALAYLERKADSETEREKVRTQATVEHIRSAVQETQILADLNKAKLQFPWFWVLISAFVIPLAVWWTAVLAVSTFNLPYVIADLPNAHMRGWAGDMIKWLFYVGTGVGALKLVTR